MYWGGYLEGGETPSLPYQVDISNYQSILRRICGRRRNTHPAIPGRFFKLSGCIEANIWRAEKHPAYHTRQIFQTIRAYWGGYFEGGEIPSLPYQVDISNYQDVLRRIFGGRRNTQSAIPGRNFKLSGRIKADMWQAEEHQSLPYQVDISNYQGLSRRTCRGWRNPYILGGRKETHLIIKGSFTAYGEHI